MAVIEDILKANKKYFNMLNKFEEKRLKGLIRLYKQCRLEILSMIIKTPEIPSYKRQWAEALLAEIDNYIDSSLPTVTEYRIETARQGYELGTKQTYLEMQIGIKKLEISEVLMYLPTDSIQMLYDSIPNLAGQTTNEIKNKIRLELTKGIIKGESVPKIAKRVAGTGLTQEGLKKPFSSIYKRALTITRTEIIKASDEGTENLLQKAKNIIDEPLYEKYLPYYDDRTSRKCKLLGAGLDGRFKQAKNMPPGVYRLGKGPRPVIDSHPNCRCRRIPFMPEWIKYDQKFNFDNALENL